MLQNKSLARNYFKAFQKQDTEKLFAMLAAEVFLKDWDACCCGKERVCKYVNSIFSGANSIDIEIVQLLGEGNTVVAEIEISIDQGAADSVVDIIVFDDHDKIRRITAFKG